MRRALTIGYTSGYASTFMGKRILVREVECLANGHARCRAIVKPVEVWSAPETDRRYLQPLRNSITCQSDDASVEVGTNVVYAPAHQFARSGTEQVEPHTRRVTMVLGRRLAKPAMASVRGFKRKLGTGRRWCETSWYFCS